MDIIVTKWIGLSATVRLAKEKREQLRERFPESFLCMADELGKWLTEEPLLAENAGAKVYKLGRGGIFSGLWTAAEQLGCGIHANLRLIPVCQETVEFCEFFDLNPYYLESFGSSLIFAQDGSEMLEILEERGIPACRIGRTTDENDRIFTNEGRVMYLTKPQPDELEKMGL